MEITNKRIKKKKKQIPSTLKTEKDNKTNKQMNFISLKKKT